MREMGKRYFAVVGLLITLVLVLGACTPEADSDSVDKGTPMYYWLYTNELFTKQQIVGKIVDPFMEDAVDYLIINWNHVFDALELPIKIILNALQKFMVETVPWPVMLIAVFALGYASGGWRLAWLVFGLLLVEGILGYWDLAMSTVAMIITAVSMSTLFGVPLGILASRNDRFAAILRPILDGMQTIHPFVYLVPIVMFFGIGKVPGTMATMVYAIPPIVRLTNLGIRQVSKEVVEASISFGATDRQTLFEVQLPLAMPTIMAGLNQTLMMALAMVVIVAMIAGGGLGSEIIRGVNRLEVGRAVRSGLAVLILAVVLDRLSQARAKSPNQDD